MSISERLSQLRQVLESGKARTLGGGAVVDREQALRLLAEIQASLPTQIEEAQAVLDDADAIRANAQARAEQIVAEARGQADRIVSEHEIVQAAEARALEVEQSADRVAKHKQLEVDAYVEAKLASFEGNLTATLESVRHGRQKLASVRLPEADQAFAQVDLTEGDPVEAARGH